MGQIVGGAAKPKRCNLNKLSQLGTPAAGEYILVSSDNSMTSDGQGNFDCYIIGDGTTAATELKLQKIDIALDELINDEETLVGALMDLNDKKANREELPNTDNLELVASAAIIDLKDRIIPNEFIQEINLNKLVEDGAYYANGLLKADGSTYGGSNVGIHYIFANNKYHKIYAKTRVRTNSSTGNGVIAFYSSSNDISVQSFISSIRVSAFDKLVEYYVNVPTNTKLISVSFGTTGNTGVVYEGQDIKVYRDIKKIDFRPIVNNLATSSSDKSLSSAMGADLYADMFHNDAAHARTMQKGKPFMKNVFLDCGRKFFSVANIKRVIDMMATVDLRNLILDYSNHQGFRFALNDMSITTDGITYDISQGLSTDYLSQSDMDELISYAKNKNVNIIGGLNLPGHALALLGPIFGRSVIDLDSETQQQFAAAVTEKYTTYFESKGAAYYYLGGDESGKHAKYGFFMNRMMHIILKHNMIPLIWNDQICRSDQGGINNPYINDGAICMFWGANNQGAQTIERNNFQQINSSMNIYWILGHNSSKVTIEGINQFNINVFQGNNTVRKNIVGAQFCMWMDGAGGVEDLDNDGTDVINKCLPLIEAFGNTIMNQTGIARTSTYRPTNPTAGDFFYDTTINKPIWYNGTNWVDATGTNV